MTEDISIRCPQCQALMNTPLELDGISVPSEHWNEIMEACRTIADCSECRALNAERDGVDLTAQNCAGDRSDVLRLRRGG